MTICDETGFLTNTKAKEIKMKTMEIQSIIDRFGMKQDESRTDKTLYRGQSNTDIFKFNENWYEYGDFCSSWYRRVFINLQEKAIFTYTEGDVNLEFHEDSLEFFTSLKSAAEFYAEN